MAQLGVRLELVVNVLVPGISTLSSNARHFALYWALADFATASGLDAAACQTFVRCAESALAWASLINPQTGDLTGPAGMHGANTVRRRLAEGKADQLSAVGKGSYSTRNWGYWEQYKGSAVTLGIASSDKNAIRAGRRPCPPVLREMFQQLFTVVAKRPALADDVAALTSIAQTGLDGPDVAPVRALMTATRDGTHNPAWIGDDLTRRSTLRILARAVQLEPAQRSSRAMLSNAVAYGDYLDTDPVYIEESARAHAWRGLLLRHRSVSAWRLLWSVLVDQVLQGPEPIGKSELPELLLT